MSEERSIIALGHKGIQLTNFEELFRFSQFVAKSNFAPRGIDTPEKVFIAVQMGLELGMSPMMALQNCAVINGRPGFYGELVEAVIQSHPEYEDCVIEYSGSEDDLSCEVTLKRKGRHPRTGSFSMKEAKAADLLSKKDTWGKYPRRMLYWRAFGFAKGLFSDVLKGFKTTEELSDTPLEMEAKVLPMKRAQFKKHDKETGIENTQTMPREKEEEGGPGAALPEKEERQAVPISETPGASEVIGALLSHAVDCGLAAESGQLIDLPSETIRRLRGVDADGGPVVNPKLNDLDIRIQKAKVTASEVIGALMSHTVDCGFAAESGELKDLPPETVELCVKQWPTVIFTIERHRKGAVND